MTITICIAIPAIPIAALAIWLIWFEDYKYDE